MLIQFNSGMTLNVEENKINLQFPDGENMKLDVFGNVIPEKDELSTCVTFDDYIHSIPDRDFCVVSMLESGYYEEQKFDLKKATLWKVVAIDNEYIYAVSAESLGELKLSGLAGYENCISILRQLSIACMNDSTIAATALGNGCKEQIHIDDITKVQVEPPYSNEVNVDQEILDALKNKSRNGIWLAARALSISNGYYYFGVKVLKNGKVVDSEYLNKSYIAGTVDSKTVCYDVFPVLCFKPWAKIQSGDGSKENPYVLTE